MAKYGAASVGFWVGGYNFLSRLKSITLKLSSITEQTDGIGDAYEVHSPVDKSQTTVTQQGGLFNTTATTGLHAAMATGVPTTPQSTPRVGLLALMGQSVGAVAYGLSAAFTVAYETLISDGKLTTADVTYAMQGPAERGQLVQPLATKTADWNTKTLGTVVDYALDPSQVTIPITSNLVGNPTVITTPNPHGLTTGHVIVISGVATSSPTINGERTVTVISDTTFSVPVNVTVGGTGGTFVRCNSLSGGAGYQQVPAFSGFSSYEGKLRDSADDTTYADIGLGFTSVTSAPASERIAFSGTIDRYVSHDGDVTGSGSIDVVSALMRVG